MSTRISSLLLLAGLALAGCNQNTQSDSEADGRIPCALGDATSFDPVCTVDRDQTEDGLILTVRHPDGGFHRLQVTRDGRGVIAADGAVPAKVTVIDSGQIEVAMEDARYRLPARVNGPAAK